MNKQGMLLVLILFIFCMFFPGKGIAEEKVDFKTYKNGIELVKDLNKKGFLYFRADW
ncbi:MAG: hypothetical protein GY707_03125 [Desulfobacteraceae bacterium]|nr:hypothetical protein [Desulfobacteraceae bacterium]